MLMVLCPVIAIATASITPALERLRAAHRLRSSTITLSEPLCLQAVFQASRDKGRAKKNPAKIPYSVVVSARNRQIRYPAGDKHRLTVQARGVNKAGYVWSIHRYF
jgi:hypothetical protein